MGAELNKIMALYGISTTTPALYTGSTSGAQAEADKIVYDQYKKDYADRIANTDMYNQAIFSTNNANVPAILTLSAAQKNALGAVPAPTGEATAGQQFYGIDQSGLNRNISDYMATSPSTNDLMAFKQKYGINDWDIRNAMGTGQQRGAKQWSAPLMNPTYIPVNTTIEGSNEPTVTPGTSGNPTTTNPYNPRYYDEFDDSRLPAYKIGVINRGRYNTQQAVDGRETHEYAQGGAVKGYQEGGQVDRAAALQDMLSKYGVQDVDYSDAISAAKAKKDAEAMALNDLITKHLSSPQESKAERYFRLASAFGAPTKTGHFSENLALATSELANMERAKQEKNAQDLRVLLNVQRMKMQAADEELAAQLAAENAAKSGVRDIATYGLKKEIDALYSTKDNPKPIRVGNELIMIGEDGKPQVIYQGEDTGRNPTAFELRLAALDAAGATPEEKKAFLLGTSKSGKQSTLSQLAEAYGYPEGTPEHAAKLKELAELNVGKTKAAIAAQKSYAEREDKKASKPLTQIDEAIGHINRLDELIAQYGTEQLPTNKKALLEAAYGNAIDAVRLLGNTGVFNVGELPFLEKKVRDPTSLFNLSGDAIRVQLKENIDALNRKKEILGFSQPPSDLTGDPDVDQYLNQ